MTRRTSRPDDRAHVDALMAYEHEMFGTEAWSADSYRAELADTRTRYYVAVEDDDGALLGWGGVLVAGRPGRDPDRRRGAGRATARARPADARRRCPPRRCAAARASCSSRCASTTTPAIALYETEGFAEIGRRRGYYDDGRVDAVVDDGRPLP